VCGLSEEKLVSVIRDLAEAYMKRDVEKMLSFLTEDMVWAQPEGTFTGKKEVKRFLVWDAAQRTPDFKVRDAGIGIIVKGNKAVYEYVFEGSMPDGRRYRDIPGITVYEFSG
jgi:ketosteroid isomerase-like protein